MTDVLVIDNFDSFTFNLVDAIARSGGRPVVRRNQLPLDEALRLLDRMDHARVVLSPGPGHPRAAGLCVELVVACPADVPLLGICLGHQAIVEAFGGVVSHADSVVHGHASTVHHAGGPLFAGVSASFPAARYHSLAARELGSELRQTARLDDGTCMAVQHVTRPTFGLQFHPESILTPAGGKLIENFVGLDTKEPR